MRTRTLLIGLLSLAMVSMCCCLGSLLAVDEEPPVEIPLEVTPDDLLATLEAFIPEATEAAPLEPVATIPAATVPVPANDGGQPPVEVQPVSSQRYTLHQTLQLVNEGTGTLDEMRMRIALVQSIPPYQTVFSQIVSPENYDLITDEDGNQYAEFWFYHVEPFSPIDFFIEYDVQVNGLDVLLGDCTGTVPTVFTMPEPYIESTAPNIQALAANLAQGQPTVCGQVEAFYTYVGQEMDYVGYNPSSMGADEALAAGGGDCTEFAGVMIALSRAAGVPARFLEGITYSSDGYYTEGDTKHDWLEVYLPGVEWVPMDPTWGRGDTSIYFAGVTPDHIVFTRGRNLEPLEGGHYWAYRWWDDDGSSIDVEVYNEQWLLYRQ